MIAWAISCRDEGVPSAVGLELDGTTFEKMDMVKGVRKGKHWG